VLDPNLARKLMTVTAERTVVELRGMSCMPLELVEPIRKGIAVTRSFGTPVFTWASMSEAIVSYAARAAEKLRRYKITAHLSVLMHTSAHNNDPRSQTGVGELPRIDQ
jgi:DNA polymerase V